MDKPHEYVMENERKRVFNLVKQNICVIIPELKGYEFKYDDRLADLGANSRTC